MRNESSVPNANNAFNRTLLNLAFSVLATREARAKVQATEVPNHSLKRSKRHYLSPFEENIMKLSRIWTQLGLAAALLLAIPFGAQAQVLRSAEAPNYNYIGIGGSDEGFVVNSKFSVADNVSIRPELATDFDFDDDEDVSYLVPITYDFRGGAGFSPFVGAGISGDIGDDDVDVEFATVAGVDYRFADNYVANGSLNYAPFADDDEVGFTLGVGYLF